MSKKNWSQTQDCAALCDAADADGYSPFYNEVVKVAFFDCTTTHGRERWGVSYRTLANARRALTAIVETARDQGWAGLAVYRALDLGGAVLFEIAA